MQVTTITMKGAFAVANTPYDLPHYVENRDDEHQQEGGDLCSCHDGYTAPDASCE